MSKIGQYDIIGELGRGGMGVVYDAIDPRLDRHVAIKVIELPKDPSMTEQTKEELIERFRREAKASAKLNHPNIVSIFDFGEQDGRYYMVMEFLQGRNLSQLLQIQSPMSVGVALKSLVQTCHALDFAHHQGIIHRDIKPANIVILDNGTTKLADFGIARLESSNSALTQAGSILGSLLYISPEQLMNPKDVDKRADIYSLGVTAYEILTGQLPYNGSNVGEIVVKIMQSEPPRPSQLNPQIPSELDAIIFKAMAKTADMRYNDAQEMAAALNQVLLRMTGTGEIAPSPMIDLNNHLSSKIDSIHKADDNNITQYGSQGGDNTQAGANLTLGSFNPMGGSAASKVKEFNLVDGVDDPTPFAAILRVIRSWNVENLSTNTLLEAIYKNEGKSLALIVNNAVILLMYKGLLVGAVVKQPELSGAQAYQYMAAWQKFEMTQCVPLEKDEPWLVLLAIMAGAHSLAEHNPMCPNDEVRKLMELYQSRRFSGMIRVIEKQRIKWTGMLDGQPTLTISLPHPQGKYDAEFSDVCVYTPRFALVGPSLRKLLVEAQLQVVSKSTNRPMLSHFHGTKEKQLSAETMEEALRNTDLTAVLPKDATFEIGNRQIRYSEILKETNHYQIINWLMYEHMYALSRDPKFASLKKRFSWAWQFKSMKFLQPVKMGGSSSVTFDILAYNPQDQLAGVFRIENESTPESLQALIKDVRQIRAERPEDTIQAAVLVSQQPISPQTISAFHAQTQKPGNIPLFSSDPKGYVKLGWNQGFFVFLVHYTPEQTTLIAPAMNLAHA
jgi:serine/threonine protein kinase